MLYLGIFGLEFQKALAIFQINALKFVWLQSLVQNKNPEIWDQKCLICLFMGLEFENIVAMFQISVLKFDLLQSLVQK